MATKKSVGALKEADLKGKRVFVRVDLNVPLDDNFNITDDTRIRAAVPTIKYLMGHGSKVILSSHLGRPKGVTPKYSLKPLVPRLSELLGVEVKMANDCIGAEVEKLVAEIPDGGVLLLENVRFYKEEEKNVPEFAKKLASLADVYVNDAFGTAHRPHASTEGVAKFLKPSVAGFLMQKELDYLVGAVANPKKPFAAIVGGSKVSTKIGVIESLLAKVDILLLGGGMIFTFYKAQGYSVGSSLVEEDKLELATSLLEKAKAKGVSLLLPTDVVIADKFAPDANSKVVSASEIPDGWMGLDIGPDSINTFSEALDTTKTIIWNGPMGVFEFEKFAAGTEAIAKKLAELSGKGAQICKSVGFRRSQVSALETLTLVATKYLEALGKSAVSFSNAASRSQSNLLDLTNAIHDLSLRAGFTGASTLYDSNCLLKSTVLEGLSCFVRSTDEIPFAKPIERAKEREREGVKASPGNLQRGAHVPEWLPGFPHMGSNEKSKKRVNGEELWENSSSVLGCQIDVLEDKRNGGNGCKLAKKRTRVKFRINGVGKRMHWNRYSANNEFTQTKDEDAEAEYKNPVKSKEAQTLVFKRRKR